MHNTEKDIPRFVILLLDVLLHLFREGLIACLISLDDLASLFENDDDVIVFVDYSHGKLHIHAAIHLDDLSRNVT